MNRSFLLQAVTSSFVLALAASGCAMSSDAAAVPPSDAVSSADKIQPFDDPDRLLGMISRTLADNISEADVGQTFGTPDENAPYPDTYWPMDKDGINVRWNNGAPSPLEKFIALTGGDLARAQRWNSDHAGKDVPGVASWFGICHGWAGAASAETPMRRAVFARMTGGQIEQCNEGENACIKFEIGDLNALMATIYADGRSSFIGARCDTAPANIIRDADGRIDREANGAGCKGLNPGSLLLVLNHRLKKQRLPFVFNAQNAANTDQIWNQPAYRYTVNRFEKLDEATATNLVASGQRNGRETKYRWNDDARGYAFVDVTVQWVTERGPNTTFVSGVQSTKSTRMTAVIELDRDANDPAATIIGGELTEDTSAETNRLLNHPFVWISITPGPDNVSESTRNGHNPHVKTSIVQQLMALGRE